MSGLHLTFDFPLDQTFEIVQTFTLDSGKSGNLLSPVSPIIFSYLFSLCQHDKIKTNGCVPDNKA